MGAREFTREFHFIGFSWQAQLVCVVPCTLVSAEGLLLQFGYPVGSRLEPLTNTRNFRLFSSIFDEIVILASVTSMEMNVHIKWFQLAYEPNLTHESRCYAKLFIYTWKVCTWEFYYVLCRMGLTILRGWAGNDSQYWSIIFSCFSFFHSSSISYQAGVRVMPFSVG